MIALLVGLACGTPEPPAPEVAPKPATAERAFELIYAGNMDGEIEPCG